MGFNAMRPGRVSRADVLFLISAVVVVAALVVWAAR
jgi:hypothetical protein